MFIPLPRFCRMLAASLPRTGDRNCRPRHGSNALCGSGTTTHRNSLSSVRLSMVCEALRGRLGA